MAIDLKDSGRDVIDLDFEIPDKGVSTCRIEEGIQQYTNPTSGKTSLRIPLVIEDVAEGPESNIGLKLSHFCPIETAWGEKQLAGILSLVGLMDACAEKFGTEVDSTSEKFLNYIKLKLPDKLLKVHHDVRTDNKGRERPTVARFERLKKNQRSVSKPDESKGSSGAKSDW
jgi:hypothetical protein